MPAKEIKEVYGGYDKKNNLASLKIVLTNNEELSLSMSREVAMNLLEQTYLSLDIHGVHAPKKTH